jgi:superfamily I DNA/RNA helicase
MNITKVYGPPGCGKTTFLLNKVAEELALNTPPMQIGFFSFTNKAADEAKFRAVERFPNYGPKSFYYFRTLHSLALDAIGGSSNYTTMSKKDWEYIGDKLGLTFTGSSQKFTDETLSWDSATTGDKIRALCDLARLRGTTLKEAWRRSDIEGVSLPEIERFALCLSLYKKNRGMIDFCDMLELAKEGNLPAFKLLIVDEAQDMSSLQWDLTLALAAKAEVTYAAGDDDQAIFQWAGADVSRFNSVPGKKHVLSQSYRIPKAVHKLATRLQKSIKDSEEKIYKSRDEEGVVKMHPEILPNMIEGSWLILVRNNYQLQAVTEELMRLGYWFYCKQMPIREDVILAVYSWQALLTGGVVPKRFVQTVYKYLGKEQLSYGAKAELERSESLEFNLATLQDHFGLKATGPWYAEMIKLTPTEVNYIRTCLRNKEKLSKEPRIKVSTIHGAKGGEADNVVLFTDFSRATQSNFERFSSDEYRVWYVGVTRTRQTLHIMMPKTNTYFEPICHL